MIRLSTVALERHHYRDGIKFDRAEIAERISPFAVKYAWFMKRGYIPHYWQTLFHTMTDEEKRLLRFRNLVAGRRGGKTMGAAWDVNFYLQNPRQYHMDVHGKDSNDETHWWVLVPNYKSAGRAAIRTLNKALRDSGLTPGVDYKFNKGDLTIEFLDGTYVEFKSAEQADTLVGAGLDGLWLDEAAVIPTDESFNYASPALDDKLGIVICTTTPRGKNWYWELFWHTLGDDREVGSVEYRSIDNPYFPRKAWEYRLKSFPPMLFKQEYMAAFDAMAGKDLQGDWLHYYTIGDADTPDVVELPRKKDDPKKYDLELFMGVDPATGEGKDRFAMVLLGVSKEKMVFILDIFAEKIKFPDQYEKIQEWYLKWRPKGLQYIGVESNAFQRALVQQSERMSTAMPTIPIFAKGKKSERIISMSPLFKIGRVRIRKDQKNFIDEWVSYDSELSHPKDDILDATEIALRTAGALLPMTPKEGAFDELDKPAGSIEELAWRFQKGMSKSDKGIDEHMGGEW